VRVSEVAWINPSWPALSEAPLEILYMDIESVSEGHWQPIVISRETAPGRARRRLQRGDSIVSMVRPNLRHYAFIDSDDDRLVASTGFVVMRPKPEVSARFLYYALTTPATTEHLARIAEGATSAYPAFKPSHLADLDVNFPPRHEQDLIASLLGGLDDKIDLNRRASSIIERLARSRFAKSFGLLDPNRLPADWNVTTLGDHLEVVRGLSYTGEGLADEGIALHNLDSIDEGGGYKYRGIKYYRSEYRERHLVRPGDVIVANTDFGVGAQILYDFGVRKMRMGSHPAEQAFDNLLIGCPAIVPERFGIRSLFSHHLYRVRPKASSPMTSRFIYLMLMSPRLRQVIVGYSNGTTVNMLPNDALERPKVAIPPAEMIRRFDEFVSPLLAKQEQLQLESETLAKLRDLLLPKLISGEIRLKEAEQTAAEAI
jgi:type I restriction enzyme, S subunit